MPFLYILRCVDDTLYTGSTWDLSRRMEEHLRGEGARHTAKRLPVELVYFEEFERIDAAFDREKQIQRWTRAKKLALIHGDDDIVHRLAQCRNETYSENRPGGSGNGSLGERTGTVGERSRHGG
jgi:putative endonuclease